MDVSGTYGDVSGVARWKSDVQEVEGVRSLVRLEIENVHCGHVEADACLSDSDKVEVW